MNATSEILVGEARLEPIDVLLDASALLLASNSVRATLASILDLAHRIVSADACAVRSTDETGSSWRTLDSRGLSSPFLAAIQDSPEPRHTPPLPVVDVFAEPALQPHAASYREEGISSLLSVPLRLDGARSGTITFYWHKPCSLAGMEIPYASALANLASTALTLSELQEANQREKTRLTFLAEASATLASSLDYEITLQRVARLATSHIADWCVVHILENGVPTRLVVTHRDPVQQGFAEEYTRLYPEKIYEDRGLGLMLRNGQTILTAVNDELLVTAAEDAEHLRLLRRIGINSTLLVALRSHGEILGAIRFVNCNDTPRLTPDDIPFAEDLARRAAMAIENAELHRAVIDHENRLRLTHAAARMGSWSWDLVRGHVLWSPEFRALHGLAPDAVANFESGASLIHPDDRDQVLGELKENLASRAEHLSYEHRAITPDDRILWVHSRGRIERNAHGVATGITGISIDVTERHQAEDALRRTEKLAAAGRLAATVAHEVNNPLEALVNLVYLAQHVPGLPAEAAQHLAVADKELGRMAHIVRQTLGFYRESTHPALTHLGGIVAEVIALYNGKAQGRSVTLHTSGGDIRAFVNGGEIRQVLANLVSNAIDASPPHSEVRITLQQHDEGIQIDVADTGCGISPAHLERIFEPFFTTKSDVGTGLGLWVSKGIIEKHRGAITVQSSTEPTRSGTTFTVSLPLDPD